MAHASGDLGLALDTVRQSVRESRRALLRSRRSYEIQQRNVKVAERRYKLAVLEQKEGQASARDVLEADEALRAAQNGRTSALLGYATARLTFLASLGMIDVAENGRISERKKPFPFHRLARRYKYLSKEG